MASSTSPPPNADPDMLEGFKQWTAIGKGGISSDWPGYLQLLKIEKQAAYPAAWTTSLGPYKDPEKWAPGWSEATQVQRERAVKSFLKSPLPEREGPQARAKHFVLPQREKNADVPHDPEVKEALFAVFHKLGDNYSDKTEWRTSQLEKRGQALFALPEVPLNPIAASTKREICHIHGTDISTHVTLSFADAEEVISKGWGERHRLSGTNWIPLGFTFLYVPRSVKEVEVLAEILEAGVELMLSG